MTISIFEKYDSREQQVEAGAPSADLTYVVLDSEDEIAVRALVELTIPAMYSGLTFQNYRLVPQGGGVWEVKVRYGVTQPKEAGTNSFQFDTTGEKTKLLQSLATASFTPLGEAAINFNGGINVNQDKLDGVDVTVPTFNFSITRVLGHPLNGAYAQALYEKTGKVNSDTVVILVSGITLTFNPGELLYLGATGGQRGTDLWEITLKCAGSRNKSNFTLGGITVAQKKGWHYLWVYYEDEVDAGVNALVKLPRQVNVEQVYEETTLSELFI